MSAGCRSAKRFRLLESQGIVVNERYRGMRLMSVNIDRLEKILKVRLALENYACREIVALASADPLVLRPLESVVEKLHAAARAGDGYGLARLDTEFHHCLCRLSGNEVLVRAWEPLSRQLTIIFGLSTLRKDLEGIAAEHDDVIAAIRNGDIAEIDKVMEQHILEYSRAIDYEGSRRTTGGFWSTAASRNYGATTYRAARPKAGASA